LGWQDVAPAEIWSVEKLWGAGFDDLHPVFFDVK
jgi:hypothetical protein